jgi:hypothetical protein
LAPSFDPSITIAMLNNLVRHLLNITLNFSILKLSTDKTLGGEQGVLRVNNGLSFCGNTD